MSSDLPTSSEKIKWRLDLWVHQNTLLWSRIQWIYWIQVPAIGAIFAVKDNSPIQWTISGAAILLTLIVMSMIDQDTHTRDRHRLILNELGFDFFEFEKDEEKRFEVGAGSWKAIGICVVLISVDIALPFLV